MGLSAGALPSSLLEELAEEGSLLAGRNSVWVLPGHLPTAERGGFWRHSSKAAPSKVGSCWALEQGPGY